MIRVLYIIIVSALLQSCSGEYLDKKGEVIESHVVPGARGFGFRDVAKIRFEREGKGDTITIKHTGTRLASGDSVLFRLDLKNPRNSKLIQVIYRYDESEAYIPIDMPREKITQYHAIDKKPLFKGVMNYVDNDSVVQVFLKQELLKTQRTIPDRIGLYLIIDQEGKASLGKVYDSDVDTEKNLRKVIERMPLFEPGEHRGKKVKVSYLVEIK
ncbi:hypothetical protein GYM62_12210 [Algoriphagus sp. NBT04N3]|jgi:hypothetical protein|uniref:hypothetical protein n=1 Tax=Algoriphagus sp. NBT04N3 TaxID=2705473 RepID=UPI001C63A5F9|nr:hypothetical protein [Algoriphagus sp. NBT04N3]QYH39511.1 hypothetical protein GYM62_12210 [Algoriphagus sp. NBT04N3]